MPPLDPAVTGQSTPAEDPLQGMSRADAMAAMRRSRRESVAGEMAPEDAKAYLDNAPVITTTAPGDEDTDDGDAVAEAERKRLEAVADAETKRKEAETADVIDPAAQLESQRREETVLADADLDHVKVPVKINGRSEMRTVAELRAMAQKTESADNYLAQAKDLLTEVRAERRSGAQPVVPAKTDADAPKTTDAADPVDAAIDSLFGGDEATAKRLLKEAISGRSAAVAPEQVAREVEQRIVIRSALRQFAQDHKDIIADPTLRRVADTFLLEETGGKELTQLEPDQVSEALERTGTRTKEWVRKMAGVAPSQQRATTRDEKRALKDRIDELPTAATRSSTSVPLPRTASSIIEDMAKARGQQVAAR